MFKDEMLDEMHEKDELIKQLEQQVADLKKGIVVLRDAGDAISGEMIKFKEKAKAWDDLEALVDECKDQNKCEFIEIDDGEFRVLSTNWNGADYVYEGEFNKEAVSNALKSIKGEG